MSKNIVPFSDAVAAFEVSGGAVVNHLSLPVGTDTERIGMNVDRLETLARWAGAKQLMLVNADLGYERPDMYDIQENGGDVATARGLKKHPKQKLQSHTYDDATNTGKSSFVYGTTETRDASLLASYKADSLTLFFDTNGLQDKVASHPKNKKGVTDESIWTRVLDSEIRSGITTASYTRYIHGRYLHGVLDPVVSSFLYENIIDHVVSGNNLAWASFAVGAKTLQLCAQGRSALQSGEGLQDANWTTQIFTTCRTDRLIATALSSRIGGKTLTLLS